MKKKALKKKDKTVVSIEFDNKIIADHFLNWLCESGEQDYWQWQEVTEEKECGDITAVIFSYDFKKLSAKTKSGRLTKNIEEEDDL